MNQSRIENLVSASFTPGSISASLSSTLATSLASSLSISLNTTSPVHPFTYGSRDVVPEPPRYILAYVTGVYFVLFTLGLLGNGLVVAVVCHRRTDMRTTTNCFIVNLSVADVLVIAVSGCCSYNLRRKSYNETYIVRLIRHNVVTVYHICYIRVDHLSLFCLVCMM